MVVLRAKCAGGVFKVNKTVTSLDGMADPARTVKLNWHSGDLGEV